MRNICFLAGICLIGFTCSLSAQTDSAPMDMDAVIQSLTAGQAISTTDIISEVAGSLMDSSPVEQQISAIQGQLVSDAPVQEVNQTAAETLTLTGRYPPRLKVDFAELPLRVLEPANGLNGGGLQNGRNGASTDAIIQRIQSRLRLSGISLAVNNRTAIISGTAETQRQRSLVESMLRFEPGIDAVRNEITVGNIIVEDTAAGSTLGESTAEI